MRLRVETLQAVLDVPAAFVATQSNGFDGLNVFGLGSGSVSYEANRAIINVTVKGMINAYNPTSRPRSRRRPPSRTERTAARFPHSPWRGTRFKDHAHHRVRGRHGERVHKTLRSRTTMRC